MGILDGTPISIQELASRRVPTWTVLPGTSPRRALLHHPAGDTPSAGCIPLLGSSTGFSPARGCPEWSPPAHLFPAHLAHHRLSLSSHREPHAGANPQGRGCVYALHWPGPRVQIEAMHLPPC